MSAVADCKDDMVCTLRFKFNDCLKELLLKKKDNCDLFSKEKYLQLIKEVKEAKEKQRKSSVDYRRLRRYDVVSVDGSETLISPVQHDNSVLFFVCTDELFDILHSTHIELGHGGRTKMEKELKGMYKNVTKETIMIYLNMCDECQAKRKKRSKVLPIATQPKALKEFNARCQVNLIDMQINSDGGYKYIMNYQDQLTKYICLRPLKSKLADEVADVLVDIFSMIGFPIFLHSDSGREFTNSIIRALKEIWPDLNIEEDKSDPSQLQGSDKNINQDVLNMLTTWMQANNTSHWAKGLRYVQFMKNNFFDKGIQQSPFKAVFGYRATSGLSLTKILQQLKSEEGMDIQGEDSAKDMDQS